MATASELFDEAKCFLCLGMSLAQALKLALLRRWLLALDPTADTTPSALLSSACINCTSGGSVFDMLEISLLSLISEQSTINTIVNSFVTRSGITDATQIEAVEGLVTNARSNGWWFKCDLIYPFVGGTAAAHAENLKSSDFTITWNGAVTHDANGITGDGATGYGDTQYFPLSSGQIEVNSVHLGIYRRTIGNFSNYCGETFSGMGQLYMARPLAASSIRSPLNDGGAISDFLGSAVGWTVASRIESTKRHLYSAGIDQSVSVDSTQIPPNPIGILTQLTGAPPTPSGFQSANMAGLTAGSGLDFDMYQLMASDWQTFETALGRQV